MQDNLDSSLSFSEHHTAIVEGCRHLQKLRRRDIHRLRLIPLIEGMNSRTFYKCVFLFKFHYHLRFLYEQFTTGEHTLIIKLLASKDYLYTGFT